MAGLTASLGLQGTSSERTARAHVMRYFILAMIYVIAFATRLFSVLRFESVIHEFDPYFNFRTTKFLTAEGFYSFHNWFDDRAWYPLGRIIGGTIYPGLMMTAAYAYWILNALNITVNIRNVCVFLAPWMSSNTALITYLLGKEAMLSSTASSMSTEERNSMERRAETTGLVSAALIAIVPGYISRSVAGSYDNEGVAIFALLATYYFWIKAVNTGSLLWAMFCTLSYFYMVSAWGGYVFIINLIPLHVLVLLVSGRYSHRLYVAYCTLYAVGTLLSMQIPFVGFQPVYSSEHMAALGVFGLLQLYAFANYVRFLVTPEQFRSLLRILLLGFASVAALGFLASVATGYLAPWTGRFYSLLDPTYAKDNIPIIASVSEHQPTTWSSFFFDLHVMAFLMPAGMYFAFKEPTDGKIFLLCYGVTSVYFSGVMVRLMLVLAPIACLLSAVALSSTLTRHMAVVGSTSWLGFGGASSGASGAATPTETTSKGAKKRAEKAMAQGPPSSVSLVAVVTVSVMLVFYAQHCVWVSSEAYSSPSIVLAARQPDGSKIIFDDFREAYYWLRMNTDENAKIMSWWDYGYQITAMANRTILVDNNTWNNTHIATVGRAMSTSEEEAYQIMRSLDVDYVLVIFGGVTGYSSDDINKFLWMVRIGGGVYPDKIKEEDYYGDGQYRVDAKATPTMLNSLMYKLSYYKFDRMNTEYNKPTGFDRVRSVEIGRKGIELKYLEEAMTSEHWIVRIYKVKKPGNRDGEEGLPL